jgi:hypothetical protein
MWIARTAALVLLALPLAAHAPRQDPPAPKEQEPQKPPAPFDERADARKDIAAALARAKKENRRVLIEWGANW